MMAALMRTAVMALVLVVAAAPGMAAESSARSQSCWDLEPPAPADASSLTDTQIDQRIQSLEKRLNESKRHGQIWFWSWLAINGGSMVGNGVGAALTSDHDDTVQRSTNAVLGAIGVTELFLRPLEARFGADNVDKLMEQRFGADQVSNLPEAKQKLARLCAAEDQLRSNAERAEMRWSWQAHAGNAALATTAGLVVGLWGDGGDGIQVGVLSLIGTTARLLTQPWRPEQSWKDYETNDLGMAAKGVDFDVVMTSLENGGRVGFRLRW